MYNLIKHPMDFKGRYTCGNNNNWMSKLYPMVINGKFQHPNFFKELFAHKPWLRDRNKKNSSDQSFTSTKLLAYQPTAPVPPALYHPNSSQ